MSSDEQNLKSAFNELINKITECQKEYQRIKHCLKDEEFEDLKNQLKECRDNCEELIQKSETKHEGIIHSKDKEIDDLKNQLRKLEEKNSILNRISKILYNVLKSVLELRNNIRILRKIILNDSNTISDSSFKKFDQIIAENLHDLLNLLENFF